MLESGGNRIPIASQNKVIRKVASPSLTSVYRKRKDGSEDYLLSCTQDIYLLATSPPSLALVQFPCISSISLISQRPPPLQSQQSGNYHHVGEIIRTRPPRIYLLSLTEDPLLSPGTRNNNPWFTLFIFLFSVMSVDVGYCALGKWLRHKVQAHFFMISNFVRVFGLQ